MKSWVVLGVVLTTLGHSAPSHADGSIPLYDLYPSLKKSVPRLPILKGPTPVQPMKKLEKELLLDEGTLWVKRDDGSDDPLGGNKARKLEFLLGEARAQGADTLVTSGMWGSNHMLATAVAGRRYCFKTKLLMGPQPVTEDVKKKLLADHALGAEMHYHGGRIGLGVDIMTTKWFPGKGVYNIPPGGSNSTGDLGYVNAFLELARQMPKDQLPERIVVPVGTMGTAAGLLVGTCLAGVYGKVRIEGVGVADPLLTNEMELRKQAISLWGFIAGKLSPADRARLPKCPFMSSDTALKYVTNFYDPGYGAANSEVFKAIDLLKKTEGLVTERTYSGKALAYMISDLRTALVKDRHVGKTMFWLTYDSYDLEKIVDRHRWTNPAAKWEDLPKDFHHLFTDDCGGVAAAQQTACANGGFPGTGPLKLHDSLSELTSIFDAGCPTRAAK